jgi:hypothetical protein
MESGKKWRGKSPKGRNVPKPIHTCIEYCAMENLGRKIQFMIWSGALIPWALFPPTFFTFRLPDFRFPCLNPWRLDRMRKKLLLSCFLWGRHQEIISACSNNAFLCFACHPFQNLNSFFQAQFFSIRRQNGFARRWKFFIENQSLLASAAKQTSSSQDQGCQMVCFWTKNPNLGKFWTALEWKMMVHFMTIWNNYSHSGSFIVIW